MHAFNYPAKFERGEKPGVFVITFRDLPEAIAGRISDGREILKPSKTSRGERLIPVPAPMALKAALYLAMRGAGMTNVELARRLGFDEKEVRRMLDPRHPTELPRIKEALDILGKRLVVSVEEAA